ncbi:MAG: cytochrome c peroxidase [Myxococcota bacterium]
MKDEAIGYLFLAVVLIGVGLFLYYDHRAPDEAARYAGPLEALPTLADLDVNMDKVALGRRLYHDGILSGDGSVSCASCHSLDHGGAEPRRTSFGMGNAVGPINSPTTLNAWNHVAQFWDGRAGDLQEQAGGPVENPGEMAATFAVVIPRISEDPWYAERFTSIYGHQGISKETITDAIAEYERSLLTPAPFDAYLAGDDEAISEEALAGYQLFAEVGCVACHQGPAVGGTMFQKMGVVNNYFERRGGELTAADNGRMNHTGRESDRHFFKVPTLRNIAVTAPYFHDGSEDELAGAVRTMAYVQLGRELEDSDVQQLVAFLESLTGELPEHARVPADEMPPERAYATPLPYDLRIAKGGEDGTFYLTGSIDPAMRDGVVSRVSSVVRGVNTDGLTLDEGRTFEIPESFEGALRSFVGASENLSQARVDFAFESGAMSVAGECPEGDVEAALAAFANAPEGFTIDGANVYGAESAAACDAELAALQAESRIEFETGSARIQSESLAIINHVPDFVSRCPDSLRIVVEGHTDNVGDPGDNLGLSRRRAAAIVDALVSVGVAPTRVRSVGYGETRPRGDNATPEGRAENRRIELHLDREFMPRS